MVHVCKWFNQNDKLHVILMILFLQCTLGRWRPPSYAGEMGAL